MSDHNDVEVIEIKDAIAITPQSEALYEAGKQMLISSVSVGREFCKAMIGTSTGAIPIYIAILTLILPEKFMLGVPAGYTIAIPAIGFLAATLLFSLGYLPESGEISLDTIDEIEKERKKAIKGMLGYIRWGLGTFVVSTLLAIGAIIINIGVK